MFPPRKNWQKYFYLILLLCFSVRLYALSEDQQETMHIVSASSKFNYKTGVNIYEGDVKIDQGSTHLTADRVETNNNDKHKIKETIAYGTTQLAEYMTLLKPGDPIFHAKAKIIKFYPQKSLVVLEGDVMVTQGENSFQGPVIFYNMKDQVVTAPASKTGRATIIIEPNKLKS
ncbi:MAG: lipopolysaccharide transport periplasmic protein LptA [Gammaproteobacteria bacterium]